MYEQLGSSDTSPFDRLLTRSAVGSRRHPCAKMLSRRHFVLALFLRLASDVDAFPIGKLKRDASLWSDLFLQSVADRAASYVNFRATQTINSADTSVVNAADGDNDGGGEDSSADDPSITGSIGNLATSALFNPAGLSPLLNLGAALTAVTQTIGSGTFVSGAFPNNAGWSYQATGLFQAGGCDAAVSPSLISNCFNLQLSADPSQDLGDNARQRIEIYSTGQESGTTWHFTWKSLSPPSTGSNEHFFHSWQILSRGGGGASGGPVVYLDYKLGAAAIGDTVRCSGICGGNGQGVSLSAWEGRVIAHDMQVTCVGYAFL